MRQPATSALGLGVAGEVGTLRFLTAGLGEVEGTEGEEDIARSIEADHWLSIQHQDISFEDELPPLDQQRILDVLLDYARQSHSPFLVEEGMHLEGNFAYFEFFGH